VFLYANHEFAVNRFRLKSFAASMVLLFATLFVGFDALYLIVSMFPR
jgi:hypothetical protein